MARPRADINDAGVCNKCGTQCYSNGRPIKGRKVWKAHNCVPKLRKAQKAKREDLALRIATVLLDDRIDDRWLRFAKVAMDYELLEPEVAKEGGYNSPFFERVENSDVADDTDTT